jgi:hypothetical protein
MQPRHLWACQFQIKACAPDAQVLHIFVAEIWARVYYDLAEEALRELKAALRRLEVRIHNWGI